MTDRPCNFCRIVHGVEETCREAKARVAKPAAKAKKSAPRKRIPKP